ncbi:MAG: DUF4190 domain-containing protein [Anaerolineae bacterium]|nr:DUF4190 domain-containing protein [Thermoflexales bacterium]MDW8407534.1 DUF4190 domain-containing protein [Anaerolineae bacterium]
MDDQTYTPPPQVANTSPTHSPTSLTTPDYGSSAPPYVAPPQTNAWAIVSLVSSLLGWLGLFGLGGIVGVVAGVVARNEIKQNPTTQTGDGLALAGIILGAANIVVSCIGLLCVLAIFAGTLSIPFWWMNGR